MSIILQVLKYPSYRSLYFHQLLFVRREGDLQKSLPPPVANLEKELSLLSVSSSDKNTKENLTPTNVKTPEVSTMTLIKPKRTYAPRKKLVPKQN